MVSPTFAASVAVESTHYVFYEPSHRPEFIMACSAPSLNPYFALLVFDGTAKGVEEHCYL
ncbi:unnamed protein product, partial [marine sediment metagenome]